MCWPNEGCDASRLIWRSPTGQNCEPDVLCARVFDLDGLTLLIAAATEGHLLEIGVVEGDGIDFIVHAMTARNNFLR